MICLRFNVIPLIVATPSEYLIEGAVLVFRIGQGRDYSEPKPCDVVFRMTQIGCADKLMKTDQLVK
ncbi:hypothetical protein L861_23220 [Litchfieldella anticariensis FP35 = DSM 16096]|uniref:Uncharacterized protein n=1 Tax=Litchfieldella anticariensis (strain DSM 16096 / CECT 5854 / CIP 108499 / LMG 22089 / FP35) TaxID=1121939 RepID=S2KRU3_LITA3|nr:hypothetical protein L861_23220 [Halomonas anticariensis FP35 = DSM 16096]